MSVRLENYLILGVKTQNNISDDLYDKLEEEDLFFQWCGEGAKGEMGILYDAMNSSYVLAGKCIDLECQENGDCFDISLNPPTEEEKEEILTWIKKNKIEKMFENLEIRYHLISHYH